MPFKAKSEIDWYFTGVYVINRTLHGRLEMRNFPSRVELFHPFAALTREIFFNTRREIFPRGHVISSIYHHGYKGFAG